EYMKAFYDELFDTLGAKGVITCVASGNEATDLNGVNDPESPFYDDGFYSLPACSDSIYCINVTAGTEKDNLASFANYGDKYVDVIAPGTNILSTVSYNCFNPTIYDESEREKLCAFYQNFDGELKSTDFGYPSIVTEIGSQYVLSKKLKFEQSDSFFGLSGKSLKISTGNKKSGKNQFFAFEIPFTINEEDKNYSISFMGSSPSETEGIVFDVPFDYDTSNIISDIEDEYQECYFSGEDCWSHVVYNAKTSSSEYEKSKERKLVVALYGEGDFIIDDFAISSQSVSSDEFGKYDFYSGTSMATPFVTGAVALIENAYPEATPLEVVNIIKNSGRVSAELQGKVKNGRCLSLDTTDKLSPMIIKADYNDEGNIEVTGFFSDITSVSVDGKNVEIVSQDSEKIIIKDNGYSTYKVKIKVENANGSDELETLLLNKKSVEKTNKVTGTPSDTSTAIMVPAGDKAYFIDTYYATIGVLNTNSPKQSYSFTDEMYTIDLQSFFGNGPYTITSAVYYNYRIYFTAVNSITSSDQSYVLGYETMLGYYDLNRGRTRKFCALPDECLTGSTLAVLNDSLYLIGGYDTNELSYIDSMYKFNFTDNVFEKTEYNLPEARAYTSFIQYNDKLVGFYGAVESGKMPSAIVFDGSGWKTSSLNLESTDCDTLVYSSEKVVKNYYGNLGIDKDGVFCNGSFVQGYGDTFTYDVENDKIIESDFCYRKNLSDARLVGTTVPGAFVGFNIIEIPDFDYDDDFDFWSNSISSSYYIPDFDSSFSTSTVYSYLIELDNTSHYPAVPTEPVTEPATTEPTTTAPKPVSPKISSTSVSLKAGATKTLSVTYGTVKSWSTSKKSVATVSNGKITALNKGTATITATLSNGQKLTCKVNVTSAPTIKVGNKKFVKSKKYPLKKNKTLKIKISGKASSVNNVYKTSNKKVAKVVSKASSKTVKIKGLKKGKAKITIKVNGVAFKVNVKVK
ncbi:MAG: S8 family serine peptidase, partial [Ruminococcus sp.]|nr:S8 family serine peptidase [Ruminococcus sp.]